MGILNLNDDSFCDDGTLEVGIALDRVRQMIAEGADIIDVGGESARTNRLPIPVDEEIFRVTGFVERFSGAVAGTQPKDAAQIFPPLLSINTWRPDVARAVLQFGGDILNDMGALPTVENARTAAQHGAALVIMHSVGEPKVQHTEVGYADIIATQLDFFREKISLALAAGIDREQIILDPGIDFAKQKADNLRIYRKFGRITELGFATLVPVSRKTVISEVLGGLPPKERDSGTIACLVAAACRGASIFRVHQVEAAWQALKILEHLENA